MTAGLCVACCSLDGLVQIGRHPLAVVGRFKCADGETKQLSACADLLNLPGVYGGVEAQRPNSGLFALKLISLRSAGATENVSYVVEKRSGLAEGHVSRPLATRSGKPAWTLARQG